MKEALRHKFPGRIASAVKIVGRRVRQEARWITGRLPRDPLVEIYSRRMDLRNRRFFLNVQRERASGHEKWLEPHYPRSIPKTVWVFWAQGANELPPVVEECFERLTGMNRGWDVRLLDEAEAERLVEMGDVPKNFPKRIYADMLRTRLLKKFGGVWLDATVFLHKPLDDWLPLFARTGFFVFTDDGPGREVSSWLIASEAGHPLICAWEAAIARHISRTTAPHEAYFHTFYVFQYAIRKDRHLGDAFAQMPHVPAPPCFLLASYLEGLTEADAVNRAVGGGLPVSKLSWRSPLSKDELRSRMDALRQMN